MIHLTITVLVYLQVHTKHYFILCVYNSADLLLLITTMLYKDHSVISVH